LRQNKGQRFLKPMCLVNIDPSYEVCSQ